MNTFDIIVKNLNNMFGNSFNVKNDNEITLDTVDFTKITKNELDEVMKSLDILKNDNIFSIIFDEDFINNLKAELQARWDMANSSDKDEKSETNTEIPQSVDERIKNLVNEYLDLKLKNSSDKDILLNVLRPFAEESYCDFAKFIYLHK